MSDINEYEYVKISVEISTSCNEYSLDIKHKKDGDKEKTIKHEGSKEKILKKFETFISIFTERTEKIELFGLAEEFIDEIDKKNEKKRRRLLS